MEKDLDIMAKLNDEVIEIICTEVKRGVPLKYASEIAGVREGTVISWEKKGKECNEDSPSIYRKFYDEYKRAKALAVAYRVENIRKVGDAGDWRANAWWLERVAHEEFGKKSVVDANINANVNKLDLSELFTDEELDKIINEK